MMRAHYLKVRLTADEERALARSAGDQGLTVSEFVRALLAREREALTLDATLARIEARLAAPPVSAVPAAPAPTTAHLERQLLELLLLTREVAAERNPQILPRVTQKLNALLSAERAPS